MYKLILDKLKDKSIAILGYGREGKSTYNFLRKHFPEKELTIIDQNEIDIDDMYTVTVSGSDYLSNLEIFTPTSTGDKFCFFKLFINSCSIIFL